MKKLRILLVLTILIVAIFALSACNLIAGPPQNLKYDGTTISWNAVEGADYYLVEIDNGPEKKVLDTKLSYAANEKEFTVKVKAVSELKQKLFKAKATEETFRPLPKISNIRFQEDGTAYWTAVANANAYAVMLNGKELDAYISGAQFKDFAAGENTIQVRPIVEGDDSWYSVWSDAKSMTKLGLPSNVTYDGEYIRWSSPAGGAFGYEVYANGIKLDTVSGTAAQYDAKNINFDVTIKSLGNHSTSFDSSISDAKRFVYLNTVSTITVADGIVNWPAVDGADSYIVKVDSSEYSVSTNAYSGLPADINKEVSIKPVSSNATYFSSFCTPKSIRLLSAPATEWIAGHDAHNGEVVNSIQWQQVLGAKGYRVKMFYNGEEVNLSSAANLSSDSRAFGYAFLEVGEYKVYLKATAEGADIYDSVYGEPIIVTRLEAPSPAAQNYIVSNKVYIEEGFRVNFTSVSGAVGYQLYEDEGLSLDYYTTTNQFNVVNVIGSENQTTQQNFVYKIRTKGAVAGNRIKLDSLHTLSFDIIVQAMPALAKMEGYNLTWGAVGDAQYNVKVGTDISSSSSTVFNLDYILPGTYPVSVNAKGNGTNILPSVFTAEVTLTRLSAVENLYVTTGENEGLLRYTDHNTIAPSYRTFEIYIDGKLEGNATVGSFANINDAISTAVSNVFVRIVSNSYDSEHPYGQPGAVYYMSSPDSTTIKLAKLAPVTFASPGPGRFTNTEFKWNAPANRNANGAYAPTYIVYKGAEDAESYHNGELAGEVLDISKFEGRLDAYNFVVKAIGDGVRYLNSDPTNVVCIIKLPTPIVTIADSAYQWQKVANASAYSVFIDGIKSLDEIHKYGETYSFIPNFTSAKSYQIKVYAMGDNGYTSIDSDPHHFNQVTKKLSAPEFSFDYSHDTINVEGTINIQITTQAKMVNDSPSTKGYIYSIGGATNASTEAYTLVYSHVVSTPGEHTLSVRAIGGDFDGEILEESFYYIASDTVGGNSHTLILLGKLNAAQIQLTMDKLVKWTAITNAISYEYEYVFDEGSFTGVWTDAGGRDNRTIDLSELWQGKSSVTIRVRAAGNGTTVITGEYTEKTLYFSL